MTQDEIAKIRSKAGAYAQSFLARKYYEEYKELYDAYLVNRGVSTRRGKELLDERVAINE